MHINIPIQLLLRHLSTSLLIYFWKGSSYIVWYNSFKLPHKFVSSYGSQQES